MNIYYIGNRINFSYFCVINFRYATTKITTIKLKRKESYK